jgi:hypothetical protein
LQGSQILRPTTVIADRLHEQKTKKPPTHIPESSKKHAEVGLEFEQKQCGTRKVGPTFCRLLPQLLFMAHMPVCVCVSHSVSVSQILFVSVPLSLCGFSLRLFSLQKSFAAMWRIAKATNPAALIFQVETLVEEIRDYWDMTS